MRDDDVTYKASAGSATSERDEFERWLHSEDDADLQGGTAVVHVPRASQVPRSDFGELADLAQHRRRDMRAITEAARQVGARIGRQLGPNGSSRAFYRYPTGDSTVEGPSIKLINALANVWGYIDVRVEIVGYDRDTRQVELRAVAIDLITLRRESVPHPCTLAPPRAKFASDPVQVQRWYTMQIRSQGSRAKRNALEQVIDEDVLQAAMVAAKGAHAALVLGNVDPVEVADGFVQRLGNGSRGQITEAVLEAWLGTPRGDWTIDELGALKLLEQDLVAGRRRVLAVVREAQERGAPSGLEAAPQAAQAAPPSPEADLGVPDPAPDRGVAREPDVEAEQARREAEQARLFSKANELRAAKGDDAWKAALRHIQRDRVTVRTPPQVLAQLVTALENPDSPQQAPSFIRLSPGGERGREAALQQVYDMEKELGLEVVGPIRVQCKVIRAVAELDDPALEAYSQALYAAGWGT